MSSIIFPPNFYFSPLVILYFFLILRFVFLVFGFLLLIFFYLILLIFDPSIYLLTNLYHQLLLSILLLFYSLLHYYSFVTTDFLHSLYSYRMLIILLLLDLFDYSYSDSLSLNFLILLFDYSNYLYHFVSHIHSIFFLLFFTYLHNILTISYCQ